METVHEHIKRFKDARILVVGDSMIDQYIWRDVTRISPEAPVPVVAVTREQCVLGGAANVAANIVALGGKVSIVGIAGNDESCQTLRELLSEKSIDTKNIIEVNGRLTTRKVRIMARGQQMLRYDFESTETVDSVVLERIYQEIERLADDTEVIVISDYAKGIISKSLMERIVALGTSKNKMIIADPKPAHATWYRGVTLVTPNHHEAIAMAEALGEHHTSDIDAVGTSLMASLGSAVLITQGEEGMTLFQAGNAPHHIPTFAREVYDVTGAGDTSIAALSLAIASGAPMSKASVIANYAAGITVGKRGTSTVSYDELVSHVGSLETDT